MSGAPQWFDVDREGLRLLLGPRGKPGVMIELVSNALDENVTKVDIRLTPAGSRGRFLFEVEDDSPEGFKDLAHAYTLFAPSTKKGDSSKRGRFNFGEKLVLAFCQYAKIVSTSGTVIFTKSGRTRGSHKRERGTLFTATLELTRTETEEFRQLMRRVLLSGPSIPEVTFNGEPLDLTREPFLIFTGYYLPTPIADDRGQMRILNRDAEVAVYRTLPGEVGFIYELGIPVVPHAGGANLHVNVLQKVPLTMDRDNVSESFRRQLMAQVLDQMAKHGFAESEAGAPWVTEALSSAFVGDETVRTVVRHRFGDKAVIYDPSDPEANKIAMAKGFTVVSGGSFPAEVWATIKRAEAILPAGRVTPSPRLNSSPDGVPRIPEEEWTDEMQDVVKHCRRVAAVLLPDISGLFVAIYPYLGGFAAAYKSGLLTLNWELMGQYDIPKLNALLLHEFAHERQSDHFDQSFLDEVCRLGALLAQKAEEGRVHTRTWPSGKWGVAF